MIGLGPQSWSTTLALAAEEKAEAEGAREEADPGGGDKLNGLLEGIRFPPLSGPGPCGLRPEHVEAVLSGYQNG